MSAGREVDGAPRTVMLDLPYNAYTSVLPAGEWRMVALVRDGSNYNLYQDISHVNSGVSLINVSYDTAQLLSFGMGTGDSATANLFGTVSMMALFNGALSTNDITWLYFSNASLAEQYNMPVSTITSSSTTSDSTSGSQPPATTSDCWWNWFFNLPDVVTFRELWFANHPSDFPDYYCSCQLSAPTTALRRQRASSTSKR